jgi:hypothetical protein
VQTIDRLYRKAQGELGRRARGEHREQLARRDRGKHDPGKVIALDRRIGHGRTIAEGAADTDGNVIRKVKTVGKEVRSQVEPSFQGVACDQLVDRDYVRRVGIAQLDDVQKRLALGGVRESVGVVEAIAAQGRRADAGAACDQQRQAEQQGLPTRHPARREDDRYHGIQ